MISGSRAKGIAAIAALKDAISTLFPLPRASAVAPDPDASLCQAFPPASSPRAWGTPILARSWPEAASGAGGKTITASWASEIRLSRSAQWMCPLDQVRRWCTAQGSVCASVCFFWPFLQFRRNCAQQYQRSKGPSGFDCSRFGKERI
jgi:hypothetical protein